MVLGWIVLFGKLNKMIINPDEIFKRTLRKSQVFGRNSKIRMVMVFKIGGMFFIWRKGEKMYKEYMLGDPVKVEPECGWEKPSRTVTGMGEGTVLRGMSWLLCIGEN